MPHPEINASGYSFTDTVSLPWRPSTVVDGVDVKDLGTANGRVMETHPMPSGDHLPHASPCWP